MRRLCNPFGKGFIDIELPDNAFVAHMEAGQELEDPTDAIREALMHPIASPSLLDVAKGKKREYADADAVIVVSDNTRPVPYKGDDGILLPVIETLLEAGFRTDEITVLIATGMHRPMGNEEIEAMIDPKVLALGIRVVNHEPCNGDRLCYMGSTKRGTRAMIDSIYASASLKILTGLVESHFMAGASGGRKSICPGIIGEESTFIFHGPELMDDEMSRDLNLEGNPVHEESLAVARLAGADFIVNVTLNEDFRITGVFAGDLEKAHLAAVENVRRHVEVEIPRKADVVITHAGFVGINHYQIAKSAVASLGALKEGGYLVTIANATDCINVIGSVNYRTTLALLKLLGPDAFSRLLRAKEWRFLPEQWQVQQWAKMLRRIPEDHYYLYAPQIKHGEYFMLLGNDIRGLPGKTINDESQDSFNNAIENAIADIEKRTGKKRSELSIIYLAEGPYEIPIKKETL